MKILHIRSCDKVLMRGKLYIYIYMYDISKYAHMYTNVCVY